MGEFEDKPNTSIQFRGGALKPCRKMQHPKCRQCRLQQPLSPIQKRPTRWKTIFPFKDIFDPLAHEFLHSENNWFHGHLQRLWLVGVHTPLWGLQSEIHGVLNLY